MRKGMAVSAAAVGFSILKHGVGYAADPIKIGLVGCGGRGKGAAVDCLTAAPNIHLIAMADLYEDRLQDARKFLTDPNYPRRREAPPPNVEVDDDHCFVGFDAYKRLIDSGVDVVLLATPPGFRPLQFEACIDAGKHVFAEKPIAVDPVGVRRFIKAGEKAKQKGLAVVAGTQRRHDPEYLETIARIHNGQIGEVTALRAYYNTGFLWVRPRQPGWSDMQYQTTNWYYFDWTCGDHIVEQHIHNLDCMNWVMKDACPVKALGIGGRQVRVGEDWGNIYDHFVIDYEYANGVHMMSMCRQQKGCDGDVSDAVVGATGTANPRGRIMGKNRWRYQGETVPPTRQEHTDLIESIRAGKPLNHAERVAFSTLTAIMGRESAYTGKAVTWDEMMKSDLDLSPPKYEFGPLPVRPVPQPGEVRPV